MVSVVDAGRYGPRLRGLTGHDERAVGAGRDAGLALVSRLIEGDTDATGFTVAERDRLLATLWQAVYGDTIAATHVCEQCAEPFDLTFTLSDLMASLAAVAPPPEVTGRTAEGYAVLAGGQVLRPITGRDEAAVAELPVDDAARALARRCVHRGDGSALALEVIERVLEWLDPTVDTDLGGRCPECGHLQSIRFSIEHYLLETLRRERHLLLRELHLLAATYGWTPNAILSLERGERRALATFVERDRSAHTGSWP